MRHNLNLKLWGVDRMEISESDNETTTQVSQISHDHTEILNQIQTNAENVQTALNEAKTVAENLQSLSTNTETHGTIQQLKADIDSLQQENIKMDTDLNIFQIQYKTFAKNMLQVENQIPSILSQIDFVKSRAHDRDTELQQKLERLSTRFNFIKENINTLKSQKTPEEILQEQRILTNELVPSNEYEDFKQKVDDNFVIVASQIDALKGKQIPKASFDNILLEIETLKTSLKSMESSYEFEELKSDFEDLETSLNDLEVQLADLITSHEDDSEITELEEKISELQTKFQDIDNNKSKIEELKTSVKDLVQLTTLTTSQQDITELQENIEDLQSKFQEIESMKTTVKDAQNQTNENLKQISQSFQRINAVYTDVNDGMTLMHNEMDNNKAKINNLQTHLNELESLPDEIKAQIDTLQSQLDTLKSKPYENKTRIHNLQIELDTLKAKVQENSIYVTNLVQNLTSLKDKTERKDNEHQTLIKENHDKLEKMKNLEPLIEKNKRDIKSHRTMIQLLGQKEKDYKANKPIKFENIGTEHYMFSRTCTLEEVVVYRPAKLSYNLEIWSNAEGTTTTNIGNGLVIHDKEKQISNGPVMPEKGITKCEITIPEEQISVGKCLVLVPNIDFPNDSTSDPVYIELYISFL